MKRFLFWLTKPFYLIGNSDKVDWLLILVLVVVTILIIAIGYSSIT